MIWEIQNDCQCSHLDHRHSARIGFWLIGELKFFIPYKAVLLHQYGTAILAFVAVAVYQCVCSRICCQSQILSKGHRRKLSHLDKQLHIEHGELPAPPSSVDEELD